MKGARRIILEYDRKRRPVNEGKTPGQTTIKIGSKHWKTNNSTNMDNDNFRNATTNKENRIFFIKTK